MGRCRRPELHAVHKRKHGKTQGELGTPTSFPCCNSSIEQKDRLKVDLRLLVKLSVLLLVFNLRTELKTKPFGRLMCQYFTERQGEETMRIPICITFLSCKDKAASNATIWSVNVFRRCPFSIMQSGRTGG